MTRWCNVCGHWDGYHHNPPHITHHLGERESFILRRLAPCSRVGDPPDALAPVQPQPPPCSASSTPTTPSTTLFTLSMSTLLNLHLQTLRLRLICLNILTSNFFKRSLCCKKNQPGGVFFTSSGWFLGRKKNLTSLDFFWSQSYLQKAKKLIENKINHRIVLALKS